MIYLFKMGFIKLEKERERERDIYIIKYIYIYRLRGILLGLIHCIMSKRLKCLGFNGVSGQTCLAK